MRKFKFLVLLVFLVMLFGVKTPNNKIDENLIVDAMVDNERELKAVWVTAFAGDVSINGVSAFQNTMTETLDIMEYYGLNAMIFHVRTHNNAFYPSTLNPKASFVSNIDFNTFDPIAWLIAECHKRGIEMHAWMNPYRIGTTYQTGTMPAVNPQSNPSNILEGTILNPALSVVKQHIYNTITEFATLYPNVDAIHFDDYFYVSTSAEPTSADARRAHISELISGIHDTLNTFNANNGTAIQFGISPTGIYKNGNGVVTYDSYGMPITTGSSTAGFEHYGDYLYADTVLWAKNGWIDYLMPQTYWARNHSIASYTKLLDWWDKVFRNLNCNLYSGIGVYMADSSSTYDWYNNMYEMDGQLSLIDTKADVRGYSIYSYKHLKYGYTGSTSKSAQQIRNAYSTAARKAIKVPPAVRTMTPKVPAAVYSTHSAGTLTWNGVSDSKFYYIFGSSSELTYSSSEIIGVVAAKDGVHTFNINNYNSSYKYGVRALSLTNHLSPVADEVIENPVTVSFNLGYAGAPTMSDIIVSQGSQVNEPTQPVRSGYNFLGWYLNGSLYDFASPVQNDITLVAQWEEIVIYNINYNLNGGSLTTGYENRDAMIVDFLTDFYNFLKNKGVIESTDELSDFMHGYGYTSGYDGWYNDEYYFQHLYEANNKVVNAATGKFINQPEYNKWVPLLDLIEEYTSTGNPEQAGMFWGDPAVVGKARIKPFIQQVNLWTYLGPEETAAIMEIVNRIPTELESSASVVTTFTSTSPDIVLPIPTKEGFQFLGWYTNSEMTGSPILMIPSGTTNDVTIYAKWKTDNYANLIKTQAGASIRTEGVQGLRYYGQIDVSIKGNQHGFYVIYGTITIVELQNLVDNNITTYEGKTVHKVVVPGVTETNEFSVFLTGIPMKGYLDKITVVAYVLIEGEIILSTPVTRSVAEVAFMAHDNGEPVDALVDEIKNNIFDYNVNGDSLEIMAASIYEDDYTVLKGMFFEDWKAKFGTTLMDPSGSEFFASAKEGTPNRKDERNRNLSNTNIYKFFNDPVYTDKWMWLLDFLLSVDTTTHVTKQITAIKGDGRYGSEYLYNSSHLSYSINNFFNAAHETGNYTAINFTNASLYDTVGDYSSDAVKQGLGDLENYFMRNSIIKLPAINKTPPAGYTYKYYDGVNYYNAGTDYEVLGEEILDIVLVEN